jgi:uncharacterized coiled-coil DUF342 family protein
MSDEATVVAKAEDSYGEKIVDLSERLNYLVKTMQEHADAINEIRTKLDQVRIRMGL